MLQTISILAILAAVGLSLLHLLIFGRKRPGESEPGPVVYRFSFVERVIHAMVAVGFLVLAGSGFCSVIFAGGMHGWSLLLHFSGAGLFILGLTLMVLRWAAENTFERCDGQWLKMLGGYFRRGSSPAPAGRFDCGQKIFFWLSSTLGFSCIVTILLSMLPMFSSESQHMLIAIHAYSALALVVIGIWHSYIALFVKGGACRTLVRGQANSNWVDQFHPLWTRDVTEEVKHET